VHINGNASSQILQEANSSSSSSTASGVYGNVMLANYGLPSRKNPISPPFVGTGFYGADTCGETVDNHDSCQLSEEMEFWYNVFIKSGQTSWDSENLGDY